MPETLETSVNKDASHIQKKILSEPDYVDRSPLILGTVKFLVKFLADFGIGNFRIVNVRSMNVYMPIETRSCLDKMILDGGYRVMFFPRHTSLLETITIARELDRMGYQTPHIVAGDNLFKGKYVVLSLTKSGMVVSDRTGLTKAEATRNLQLKEKYVLNKNQSIEVFAYDGRSKDGCTPSMKTTSIQVAIDLNTTIIPANEDCFQIPEESNLIAHTGTPYTFKFGHFFTTWAFRNLGDIRMTFGRPIIPSDISKNRNELAKYVREQMMDLIQIYSRNVVAFSKMQQIDAKYDHPVEYYIMKNQEKLVSQSTKFIDFTLESTVEELIFKAKLADKDPRALKLYGNPIRHYVDGMYG